MRWRVRIGVRDVYGPDDEFSFNLILGSQKETSGMAGHRRR